MPITFAILCEAMNQGGQQSPLMDSGEESKAMQCIRAGKSLRSDEESPFWDDFINLCSNTSGLADLLDVKEDTVSRWASKIRDALEQVEKHDIQDGSNKENEKDELLPTGDNGAVTNKNMGSTGKVM